MKKLLKKLIPLSFRLWVLRTIDYFLAFIISFFRVKKRTLFYTVRSDGKLLDNSKAVYDNLDGEKIIFAEMLPHSVKAKLCAMYLISTSKVIVTDDYCKYLRIMKLKRNQHVVQIWHACGAFKKFGLDAPSLLSEKEERKTHSQYDFVSVTGEGCKKPFASAFGIDENKCLPLGLPRTDDFINNTDKYKTGFYTDHPELKDKNIILYCPTFREENGKYRIFRCNIDFDKLNSSLAADEVFVICRHPLMNYDIITSGYDKIIDLTEESTLNLISVASLLITDYSSVIYEASLINVPILFYCPDIEKYERGFYLEFPDELPGKMITDADLLYDNIKEAITGKNYGIQADFREKYLGACDGHSTERICREISRILN